VEGEACHRRIHHCGVAVRSERSRVFVARLAIQPRRFPSWLSSPPVALHEQLATYHRRARLMHEPAPPTFVP